MQLNLDGHVQSLASSRYRLSIVTMTLFPHGSNRLTNCSIVACRHFEQAELVVLRAIVVVLDLIVLHKTSTA